jgi:hypothetical protein
MFGKLFGTALDKVPVSFPSVEGLTGVMEFEEDRAAIDLYLSTNRQQVNRDSIIGKTVGELFRGKFGSQTANSYLLLKNGVSDPVSPTYILTAADAESVSQIKSTSQAASLA